MMLLNDYLKERFGCKVYKIALNGGFTCPNRDGTIGTGGCIFCSAGGSGEFSEDPSISITEQIERGKKRVAAKIRNGKYIAYFQAYTGTYAPVDRLRELYTEAIMHPDVAVLSVATRPDCLPDEVVGLLAELNAIKPVWVELGLQTIHERTAEYIRRGYSLEVYDSAVERLRSAGIEVITHVILGLPGETREDMLETVRYVCAAGASGSSDSGGLGGTSSMTTACGATGALGTAGSADAAGTADATGTSDATVSAGARGTSSMAVASGIKLQLLHVLKGTDLEKEYLAGLVSVLTEDEYMDILQDCLSVIPDNVVIHRLTGDGDKRLLTAPLWSVDKKHVLNRIRAMMETVTQSQE